MTSVVRGIAWLGVFIGICVAPLVFALMSTNEPGQGFWTDFSVALGFVGLALMGIEFALVARVKTVAEPFGTDAVIDSRCAETWRSDICVRAGPGAGRCWSASLFRSSSLPPTFW